jgi:hypothetical protein
VRLAVGQRSDRLNPAVLAGVAHVELKIQPDAIAEEPRAVAEPKIDVEV